MTFKKTVGVLSFVLAATVPPSRWHKAWVSQPMRTSASVVRQSRQPCKQAAKPAWTHKPAAVNEALNNLSESAIGNDTKGAAGAALNGTTRAMESSGKSAVGTGLDTAAAAQANTRDTPLKIAKARNTGHAKTSSKASAGTQLKAQGAN